MYIHNSCCKCCSEINTVSLKKWIAATNFVKQRNTVPWKKLSLNIKRIKHSKLHGKNLFWIDYFGSQAFFTNYHFTTLFVHLLVLAAVSNSNIFKLIEWYPANI